VQDAVCRLTKALLAADPLRASQEDLGCSACGEKMLSAFTRRVWTQRCEMRISR
jgi:hypothetical protein